MTNARLKDVDIFERFISSNGTDSVAANELIGVFQRGFPIENLEILLNSPGIEMQRAGAFIIAEIGKSRTDLAPLLVPFVGHPDRWISHYAMETIWLMNIPLNEEKIAIIQNIAASENGILKRDAERILNLGEN